MTKEEAQKVIQTALDTIQAEGFTIRPAIQARGNKAEAGIEFCEMTATEHKRYLASLPVVVEKTKKLPNEKA